jgi:hypothetical protein
MKRIRVYVIVAFAVFLVMIMPLSTVQAADPVIVRNQATMIKPYETGGTDTYKDGGQAQANADYDKIEGMVYARASASDKSAWANSSLEDAFEIIDSSNYRITFSFNYKGLVQIEGYDFFIPGETASVKVDLKVYLIDRSGGNIVGQKTQTIYSVSNPSTSTISEELTNSVDIVLTNALDESHVYDWRAELRTEAAATDTFGGDLQAEADFLNFDYGANITQVSVVDLSPDHTAPITSYSLSGTEGENNWYASSVTVELTATDTGYGVEYTSYRINEGSWNNYTTPFNVGTEGTNTVEYNSVDRANNKETTKTVDFKIDTTPPTGQVIINNYDLYAGSEDVSLYAWAEDGEGSGLFQMRFRNEGDTWVESWINYTDEPTPWTLKIVDGTKRVFAQFKDNAGNISPETSDSIVLDTEPPTTTSSLFGTEGENGWYTGSVTITLTFSDTRSGVDYTSYRINEGSWNNYTTPFNVGTEGTNTVEYNSVDRANNKETTKIKEIKIDRTQPTGQIIINNNDAYTSSALVTLSLTYEDEHSGVSKVRYSNDGIWDTEAWEDPSTTKYWSLTSGEGTKTVYYQVKDSAGKISPQTSDTIILDTEPPSMSVLINEGDEYTNSTSVTLFLQYSDNQGVDLVRFSNDDITYTQWESATETKQWTLLPEEGTKTVYTQSRDWSGLNSNKFSDTIILDTIPPTGSIQINNGASSTTSTSVTITPDAADTNGVVQMRLRNDGEDWSEWQTVTTKTWDLRYEFGTRTVFAQFKDNAELVSSEYNATINLIESQTEPTPTPTPSSTPSERGNLIVYVKDENNNLVFGATVSSITQPTGQSLLEGTTDSHGIVNFNNIIVGTYSFHASKGSFGSDIVQITIVSLQTNLINITLHEDLTEPTISVTVTPQNSDNAQRVFSVTVEDDSQGSGLAKITLYVDESSVATWTTAGTHIYDEGVYSNGTHTYYVEAADNAGNTVRNPISGYLEFTVEESSNMTQMEVWQLLAIALVLANGTALVLLSIRRKK